MQKTPHSKDSKTVESVQHERADEWQSETMLSFSNNSTEQVADREYKELKKEQKRKKRLQSEFNSKAVDNSKINIRPLQGQAADLNKVPHDYGKNIVNPSVQEHFAAFLNEEYSYDEEIDKTWNMKAFGVEDIYEKSRILKEGSEAGSISCSQEIGIMYVSGNEAVEKDWDMAKVHLLKAARCGFSLAMYWLGATYIHDEDLILEGLDWLCKTAVKGGMGAVLAYKVLNDFSRNYALKVQIEDRLSVYFREICDKDNPTAQEYRFIGFCYYVGICCIQRTEYALTCWDIAEEQGDRFAGVLLENFGEDHNQIGPPGFSRYKVLTDENISVVKDKKDNKLNKINNLLMKLEDNRSKRFRGLIGKWNPLLSLEWNRDYDALNKLLEERNKTRNDTIDHNIDNIILDAIDNKLFFDSDIPEKRIVTSYSDEVKYKLFEMFTEQSKLKSLPDEYDYVSNIEHKQASSFVAFIDLSEGTLPGGIVFFRDEAFIIWNDYQANTVLYHLQDCYFNFNSKNLGWKIYPEELNYVMDFVHKEIEDKQS